jgi:hypothetical protein
MDELNELTKLILFILYIADECNYQGGSLTNEELKVVCNYIIYNKIDIYDIKEKCKTDIEIGIDFLQSALNKN